MREIEETIGCHVRFKFLENMYAHLLVAATCADGDDEPFMYHWAFYLRLYMLYLFETCILVDNSGDYIDVIYLWIFVDLDMIHEYNWGIACLVYLYSKLTEGCLWKIKQMTGSCALLTVIYLHPLLFMYHFYNNCATPLLIIKLYYFQAWIIQECISD